MAEDLGEKTEQPTAKRLTDARQKGQVARSQDLGAAVGLFAAVALLVLLGGSIMHAFARLMERLLAGDMPGDQLGMDSLWTATEYAFAEGVKALGPLALIAALVAYAAQFAQVGWLLTGEPIRPKIDKLDPIKGAKRLFSKRNLVKTLVNFLKLAVVILVAWYVIAGRVAMLAATPHLAPGPALLVVAKVIFELSVWLVAVLLSLALADFAYQRWQHTQDLKMTKQEVKDERRSMEGDPEIKGRRLKLAREIAQQRIAAAIPQADVIITNPEHFSVAIKYDEATMGAPRVIAKGVDFLALRIRQLARLAKVPIVERPPLARALYWGVDVGQEIAPEHYKAVAEILAYVYRLDEESGGRRRAEAVGA
ncbi:MAG: flagellar biosynthesis protein FlhB [Phycisphaerales bacterium]